MKAFHGKKSARTFDFISQAIKAKTISVNLKTGDVFNRRGLMRCVSTRGYIVGTVHLGGERRQIKAHQAVWAFAQRELPSGFVLDHRNRKKTDNRLINLRLVTHKDNAKNRRSYGGANNPAAKITSRIAKRIRAENRAGWSYMELATHFKISKSLVAAIVRRELWG